MGLLVDPMTRMASFAFHQDATPKGDYEWAQLSTGFDGFGVVEKPYVSAIQRHQNNQNPLIILNTKKERITSLLACETYVAPPGVGNEMK